jgi:recombination protein RecA
MAKKEKPEVTSKEDALALAIDTINKTFGKGSVLVGKQNVPGVQFIPSGSLALDKALGGGWARGRIVEIYGPPSSGKTTLTLHAVAEAQKMGLKTAFIDAEHALDPVYAEALGINLDELLISQPDSAEEGLQIVRMLAQTGAVGLIIVDSVAALVPQAELEKNIGDSSVGRQALMMSQAMRMLAGVVHETNTTVFFINQIRMKIGVMFGNPETTSGGNALSFYASQRVDVRRQEGIKQGEEIVANATRAKVVKNKVATPFQEAHFNIVFGKGIDKWEDLLTIGESLGLITRAGAWYKVDKLQGQGRPGAIDLLKENPRFCERIRNEALGVKDETQEDSSTNTSEE